MWPMFARSKGEAIIGVLRPFGGVKANSCRVRVHGCTGFACYEVCRSRWLGCPEDGSTLLPARYWPAQTIAAVENVGGLQGCLRGTAGVVVLNAMYCISNFMYAG